VPDAAPRAIDCAAWRRACNTVSKCIIRRAKGRPGARHRGFGLRERGSRKLAPEGIAR
jgi:hypothetical protein